MSAAAGGRQRLAEPVQEEGEQPLVEPVEEEGERPPVEPYYTLMIDFYCCNSFVRSAIQSYLFRRLRYAFQALTA